MYHCRSCVTQYSLEEISHNKVSTSNEMAIFQCPRCFCVGDPILVYNINDPCPVCLESPDIETIRHILTNCGHWLCDDCYKNNSLEKSLQLYDQHFGQEKSYNNIWRAKKQIKSDESKFIIIFAKDVYRTFTLKVERKVNCHILKEHIARIKGYTPCQLRLIFCGKILSDDS